jgi:hypothetical protein
MMTETRLGGTFPNATSPGAISPGYSGVLSRKIQGIALSRPIRNLAMQPVS